MSAQSLITELSDRGIRVRPNGQNVFLSPKSALTPDLLQRVKSEKPALLRELEKIREEAGDDWEEVAADPEFLKTFTEFLMISEMREKGIAPDHYTAATVCTICGPVPIFEGVPDRVRGCPWCFNRVKGLPMPRVDR